MTWPIELLLESLSAEHLKKKVCTLLKLSEKDFSNNLIFFIDSLGMDNKKDVLPLLNSLLKS